LLLISDFPRFSCSLLDIACGSHHSLLLDVNGRVYTFGSSEYGQQAGSTQHVDWQAGMRFLQSIGFLSSAGLFRSHSVGFHQLNSFGKRRYYYAVPRLIENALGGEKIQSIVCGDLHNIGLTGIYYYNYVDFLFLICDP
jgi:alpha-tubulin suppressor-like RCC1 family protein